MIHDHMTPRKHGGRRRDKVYNLIRRGGHHEHHHGERGGRRGGRGEKLHRLFEHGDLKRVLLALVAKKPSHGYELIKAIEEASSGLYVPSPGVIYPTLTLLEEQELLEGVPTCNGRKSYRLTQAGEAELAQHQLAVDGIFARLAQVTQNREGNLAEGISDTMKALKHTLRSNMMRTDLTPAQIAEVNQALQTAVAAIEQTLAKGESA